MIHHIKNGLDIPLTGGPPDTLVSSNTVKKMAIVGDDYIGMKPAMKVKVGDEVKVGDPLFECKKTPGVIHTSPAGGTILAINRGKRRVFQTLEIRPNSEKEPYKEFENYKGPRLDELTRDKVVALMVESGLWVSLRERPFSKVPPIDTMPHSLFITATDTNPLAPNPSPIISRYNKDFTNGMEVLSNLTKGVIHLVKNKGLHIEIPRGKSIQVHEFEGVHPAGNVGTHIHFLDPVSLEKRVWHIGYQDVIALGKLFTTGKLFLERTISLAGPSIKSPKTVVTRLGACLDDLLQGEVQDGNIRIISGSVLNGRTRDDVFHYLGRYHGQVSLLFQDTHREFLGWHSPGLNKFSIKNIYLSKLFPGKKFSLSTNEHGSLRSMVPVGSYEAVMPLDLLPTQLLRALISKDWDGACDLGCLELDEEDLALCSFVCPSKIDYGPFLRDALESIEKEG